MLYDSPAPASFRQRVFLYSSYHLFYCENLMVRCTCSEIFFKAQAPRQIDYLSLDVEGAETLVLLNFPLNQYRIHIITAERLKGPIRAYLKTHGYVFIQRITRWGESLWIHNESMHLLDMDALGRFSFPIL